MLRKRNGDVTILVGGEGGDLTLFLISINTVSSSENARSATSISVSPNPFSV